MTIVEIIRWSQVLGMVVAGLCSGFFLVRYLRYWDPYSPFARFVVTLNAIVVLTTVVFAVGRIWRQVLWIEASKSIAIVFLAGVLLWQLILLARSRSHSHNTGHEKAPAPPPQGQDWG